jgi:Zn-dependent M28 family amino/carboxypeptidase
LQHTTPSSGWLCRQRVWNRRALKRLAVLFTLLGIGLLWAYFAMIRMPGKTFSGPLPAMTAAQRALSDELRSDVETLAGEIGRRNVYYSGGLRKAVEFLQQSLRSAGFDDVRLQTYRSMSIDVHNIEVEIIGTSRPDEIIVIGAHYDSVDDCPAANDNASGVAATLALARRFVAAAHDTATPNAPSRTLRFVLFVNEEPPAFQTEDMGSLVYAKRCKERSENIVGMLSLETIGCYSDAPGSQKYPAMPIGWFYPDRGDFIGFVGNYSSRNLVREAIGAFRANAAFPSQGAALPGSIAGIGWSDHWAFWQCDYPAIMVTDSAPFRYPHYHQRSDTPDKLDYDRMARVVDGLEAVVGGLANPR